MKLYHFRGDQPNFGDELNTWLMPKVFPGFFDHDESTLFLAIGSVLFDDHPRDPLKLVFGSGYAGYTAPPKLNDRWRVYCVRGPRTAEGCGLSPDKVAGDAAILINRHRGRVVPGAKRVSFIPHWESIGHGHWQAACRLAGVDFIDPRRPVEDVLAMMEASSLIVAEAMHGAIVADALRIPWIATMPIVAYHRAKWFDWAEALDLRLKPHPLWPSSLTEAFRAAGNHHRIVAADKGAKGAVVRSANAALTAAAAARLWALARREPMLSSDAALDRALDRLESHAERIKRDFARA